MQKVSLAESLNLTELAPNHQSENGGYKFCRCRLQSVALAALRPKSSPSAASGDEIGCDSTEHKNVLDCGGKQSATPLSRDERLSSLLDPGASESGVAAALCHRSPKAVAINMRRAGRNHFELGRRHAVPPKRFQNKNS
jgi:hypothetical protein